MSERPESPAPAVALHAIVRGRVQGVNFRDFAYRRAISLGLTGYVRNLPDMRSVEVVAEGERDRLERLVEHLKRGPSRARVEEIDLHWGGASGRYTRFAVAF